MANAGVYAPSVPRLQTNQWSALIVFSLLLHAILMILVGVSIQPEGINSVPASPSLEILFTPAIDELPPASPAKVEEQASPPLATSAPSPLPQLPPPPAVQPKPPEPAPAQPQAKSKVPEKSPEPEKEAAKANPVPEEDAFETARTMMAADLAKGDAQPPKHADFIGASNSEAADRAKKDKPIGMATMEGESGAVLNQGRRGETGKPAPLTDPRLGSVKKEGAPELGKPLVPEDGHLKEPKPPEEPSALEPVSPPAPIRKAPEAIADLPARPLKPKSISIPAPEVGNGPAAAISGAEPKEKAAEYALVKPPAPEPAVAPPPEAKREPKLSSTPEPSRLPQKPSDAELDRVLKILKKMDSGRAAPDSPLNTTGTGAFKGEDGIEGNLELRPGDRDAVGDVQTEHHASVAAHTGEVAFSKAADPEAIYLKDFLGRMNQRWKVNIVAAGHTRMEFGMVQMRFSIDRSGKLLGTTVVKRTGDLSDQAVSHCKRGIEEIESPGPFPAALVGKAKITWTVTFLYR